jgi:hypothetical protein
MRALYHVLTGDDSESALTVVAAAGQAELAVLADRFVAALVDVADAYARNEQEMLDDIARRWATAVVWPASMRIEGLSQTRLPARAVTAAGARKRGQPMYCWRGPAMKEYVVVSG